MRQLTFLDVLFLAFTQSASFRMRTHKKAARVLTPNDGEDYVHALSTTNRFCPVRCASEIVQPASTSELAAWLRTANGSRSFTVKGGGHSYGCQSVPADGGVMIHTGRLKDARVFRRSNGTAYLRAGAGLTFDEIIPRLAKMGYSMPHGECITVGLGGWTMNMGQHPELKNFDNKWGYDGQPYLTKGTFVNYAGTIFTVDKDGLHLVELGSESWLTWYTRSLATQVKADGLNLFTGNLGAASNMMKIFKIWGASLAIATDFEIELLPKPEPGFFQVTYSITDLLDDTDGKGQRLMQALFEVVASGGPDPNLDCGIFYASDYFRGTKEGAIALKCTDWASPTGATIASVAPPGYRSFEPKASAFLFWTKDSYGKGWVPMWHAELLDNFRQVGGAEKYRDYLRALEHGDAAGPNACDACSSELMYMLEPSTSPHIMFDNFCSAGLSNQNACSAFVNRIKSTFLNDDREIMYKQNLPSCHANPNWKSQLGEYAYGGWELGSTLKFTWDYTNVVDFWMGLGHSDNDAICEANQAQPVGATCQQHGITAEDLVSAELAYVRSKCPTWDSYDDFDGQNNGCTAYIYGAATAVPVTDVE